MNLFLAKNTYTGSYFAHSFGPGNALTPRETSNIIEAKMCATFDEIVNALPKGYVENYDIQRWTFKLKEVY